MVGITRRLRRRQAKGLFIAPTLILGLFGCALCVADEISSEAARPDQVIVEDNEDGSSRTLRLPASEANVPSTFDSPLSSARVRARKVIVIPVNFNSGPTVTCGNEALSSIVFGQTNSVDSWYRETSFGKTKFTGITIPPVTISPSSQICDLYTPDTWANQADAAALLAGHDVNNYDHRIYIIPHAIECSWIGRGTMPGPRVWVRWCDYLPTYTHELGHNLGMHHAQQGGDEYGDGTDTMGISIHNLNAPHMVQLNYTPTSKVQSADSGGSFNLAPLFAKPETTDLTQVLTVRVPGSFSDKYYISYRTATGLSAGLPAQYANRIHIHTYRGYSTRTNFVTSLGDGEVWTQGPISVTNVRSSAKGATVNVTVDCVRENPTVEISPYIQFGAAGALLDYGIQVTNRDFGLCPATDFALRFQSQSPQLSGQVSQATLRLAPGAVGGAIAQVRSLPNSQPLFYLFDVIAEDPTLTGRLGSSTGQYEILP